jgi:hypothetical protein
MRQSSEAVNVKAAIVLLILAACFASGCGTHASVEQPPVGRQRDIARQFAEAIFRGRTAEAVALLVEPHDQALTWLTRQAARPWQSGRASVHLPAHRAGRSWVFGYSGTHTHRDGSFEEVRGDIVIAVAGWSRRVGVESFALPHPTVRLGTHHDSVLLPSSR